MKPSRQEAIETITLLLTQAIDALESGGPELVEPASELREMVTRPPRVAIAGRLKSGKSTLVNALTQHHIAATDSVECTMAVSMYLDGAPARAEVVGLDGRVDRVSLGQGPLDHLPRAAIRAERKLAAAITDRHPRYGDADGGQRATNPPNAYRRRERHPPRQRLGGLRGVPL